MTGASQGSFQDFGTLSGSDSVRGNGDIVRDVLDGEEYGLAIFDENLAMITCNRLYIDLFNYQGEDLSSNPTIEELGLISLKRQGFSEAAALSAVSKDIARVRSGASHSFKFRSKSGVLEVRRTRSSSGRVIEKVFKLEGNDHDVGQSSIENIAETAHNRMMHALEVMAEGFALFDPDDRLVVYNQKYVDLNPHIQDLIMPGAKFEDMLRIGLEREGFERFGQSQDEFLKEFLDRHQNPKGPYELQLSNGRWVLVNEKKTSDGGVVGTRSDITELKNREFEVQRISKKLVAKNVHFDTALNNMIQGLCMFDSEQRLIVCNQQYLEMYGFSAEVVKPGIQIREIMKYSISLGNYTDEHAQKALKERHDPSKLKQRTTIKQRLRDGRVIAVMNQPMPDGGTIATYQDITVLEEHEEKLLAYTKKLERSNSELQDFAYVASHDLQEPLRKIEAFGDRLARKYADILPDDGKMFVDRMQNAAGRMRQLINDLLSYSRVTTAAKPFNEVNLAQIAEDVVSDLQVRIEENKATIEFEELPTIQADPTQMRQLIQNLLSNALKFKKPDVDPVIKIAAKLLDSTTPMGQPIRICRITIADNGIGFENKFKNQIFTIFQRLHGRMEYEGTGIGLATCRKIVDRHSGTIDADGKPDIGATFIIELPVEQSSGGQ
ncbi:MAG: PAS-domain containing protein [Pseudomonadota bacterium]